MKTRFLLITILLISLGSPINTWADDANDSDDSIPVYVGGSNRDTKLKECDLALTACNEYVHDLGEEVNALNAELVVIKKQRDEAISEAAKLSASPTLPPLVWVVGGALLGALVAHELSR